MVSMRKEVLMLLNNNQFPILTLNVPEKLVYDIGIMMDLSLHLSHIVLINDFVVR